MKTANQKNLKKQTKTDYLLDFFLSIISNRSSRIHI